MPDDTRRSGHRRLAYRRGGYMVSPEVLDDTWRPQARPGQPKTSWDGHGQCLHLLLRTASLNEAVDRDMRPTTRERRPWATRGPHIVNRPSTSVGISRQHVSGLGDPIGRSRCDRRQASAPPVSLRSMDGRTGQKLDPSEGLKMG